MSFTFLSSSLLHILYFLAFFPHPFHHSSRLFLFPLSPSFSVTFLRHSPSFRYFSPSPNLFSYPSSLKISFLCISPLPATFFFPSHHVFPFLQFSAAPLQLPLSPSFSVTFLHHSPLTATFFLLLTASLPPPL